LRPSVLKAVSTGPLERTLTARPNRENSVSASRGCPHQQEHASSDQAWARLPFRGRAAEGAHVGCVSGEQAKKPKAKKEGPGTAVPAPFCLQRIAATLPPPWLEARPVA